jgi:hypothetical protein
MERKKTAVILISFFVFSLGLTLFITIDFQAAHFTILDHGYHFSPIIFCCGSVVVFFIISLAWIFLARIEANFFEADPRSRLWSGYLNSWPLSLFLLTPLLLHHYLTRNDLKTRLHLLALFVIISIIYLKLAELNRISERPFSFLRKWEGWFGNLSTRKKLVILFLAAFIIYNLCAFVLVSKGITFSGDEPYYLLATHSLLYDHDLNLFNNYVQKDYFHFYNKEDNPRLKLGIYARSGRKGGQYIYPINLPGISFLMAPYYWLSQLFKGKMLTFILKDSLSIWAALLGLQLYLLIAELWKKKRVALALWFIYSFTAPVIFYAIHLYPEIPIALFSLYIWRKVTSKKSLTLFEYFFMGFLLSTFFWFGVKYNFIFWPLLIVAVYFLLINHKAGFKVFCFLAFPLLSNALFYLFVYYLYGTFSPFAVYEGVMSPEKIQSFKEAVFGLPLVQRIETFFDYFLDQRDGLLLYSPLYLFALAGLVEIFRRAKRELLALLLISIPFLLNYAFFTHRQGYSPQARVLAPISWVGAILLSYFVTYNSKKIFSFFFWFLSFLSLASAGLLLLNPSFFYQPTTHEFTSRAGDFFVYLSNLHFSLPPFLPSFIKINNVTYLPNYLWILAIGAFVLFYIYCKKNGSLKRGFHSSFIFILLIASFLLWVLYPRPIAYTVQTVHYSPQRALGFYHSPLERGVVAKESGALYLHFQKSYRFHFSSKAPLEKIKIIFGSEKGEYEAKMTFFDLPFFEGKTTHEKKELALSPPAFYQLKNLYLYEVNITLKKLSSENMLIDPYYFYIEPVKE